MSALPFGEPTMSGAVRRYRLVVAFFLGLGLAAALAYGLSRPVQYTATAGLVLEDPLKVSVFGSPVNAPPDRYVSDQISVLKSSEVNRAASDAAARQVPPLTLSADYFSTHATVSGSQRDGNFVQVTVTGSDSATALGGVDALVAAYENVVHASTLAQVSSVLAQIDVATKAIDPELAAIEAQLTAAAKSGAPVQGLVTQQQALLARRAALASKHDQVTVDASRQSTGVSMYVKAQQATRTSRVVGALPVVGLGGAAGLLLGVACAYTLAWRHRVFSRPDEPEMVVGAALIAEIPRLPSASAVAVFRTAAMVAHTFRPSGATQMITITSAQRQQGRSTITAHLGLSMAADGMRVLLIDANPGPGGLADVLAGQLGASVVHDPAYRGRAPDGAALQRVNTEGASSGELALLSSHGDHPVRSSAAKGDDFLSRIPAGFDVLLIDAPPASELGPCLTLVRSSQVVLVVTDGEAVASVQEAARVLRVIGLSVVGYLHNHVPNQKSWPRRQPLPPARRALPYRSAAAPAVREAQTSSAASV